MMAALLGRLRSAIQLPECLRVVGYLRRMAAFSEPELRLQFLRRVLTAVAPCSGRAPAGPPCSGWRQEAMERGWG